MKDHLILVVEDERIVAMDIQQRLLRLGYSVSAVVATGEGALLAAQEQRPDLALVDIRLKGPMDGIDVAHHFRERHHLPVVFLTANTDPATVERAKSAVPFGYIIKPFDEKDLATTIELALHNAEFGERLRKSEALLSAILRCIGDGVIATDDGLAVRFLNPVAETLTGCQSDDALERPLSEILQARDRATGSSAVDTVHRAVKENGPVSLRGAVHRSMEGDDRLLDLVAWPIRETDGRAVGAVLAMRDITEHLRASEALRESQERYRDLFENASDVVFELDLEGRFLSVNAACERVTGHSRTGLLGKGIADMVAPEQQQVVGQVIGQLVRGAARAPFELTIVTKDAQTVILEASARLQHRDGTSQVVQAIARDVTLRRSAERQLARQAEELARSNQELEHFAHLASHDLREPLRVVSSYVQLIARRYQGKLDKDADEFIGYVLDGTEHMQNLIRDLLSYSRVSTQQEPFRVVDTVLVLEQALQNLSAQIEESGGTISHDPLPCVAADPTQILQLFQNLLSNSLKFRGADPPRIHLSATATGGDWAFSVRDNGIGIDPKDTDRIFRLFERGGAGRDRSGTGIGLAVCQKIVGRHQGRIWVQSEPGKGSTFWFTLPAKGGEFESSRRGEGSPAGGGQSRG